MRAMILCAGLGTRLRPLTQRWPKPALPLLGQPLLRYALATLKRAGITEVGINTHHLPDVMRATAQTECDRAGMQLHAEHEPVIQGTGGGIRGLRRFLESGPFVVMNGDTLFGIDLRAVVDEHARSGADATMVLMPMPAGEKYAAVELDANRRVRRIAGHGPGGAALSPWHFTGVHVLTPKVFEHMAASGEEDINRTVYPRMIAKGLTVRGHAVHAYWSDLGTPARYLQTQRDLLFGQVPMDAFPGASPFERVPKGQGNHWGAAPKGVGIAGPAFIDEGAVIEPTAKLGSAVYIGPRARVGSGARLNRVAVLDDTMVAPGEELVDTIAWQSHRIAAAPAA